MPTNPPAPGSGYVAVMEGNVQDGDYVPRFGPALERRQRFYLEEAGLPNGWIGYPIEALGFVLRPPQPEPSEREQPDSLAALVNRWRDQAAAGQAGGYALCASELERVLQSSTDWQLEQLLHAIIGQYNVWRECGFQTHTDEEYGKMIRAIDEARKVLEHEGTR